jgi:hypothetical protein
MTHANPRDVEYQQWNETEMENNTKMDLQDVAEGKAYGLVLL